MLYSKGNLAVRKVASKDVKERSLNCVRFDKDGSTVGSNGKVMMAVGPVDMQRVHMPEIGQVGADGMKSVSMELDIVEQAVKNLPKDKRVSTQNVVVTKCDSNEVEFTCVDTRKKLKVSASPVKDGYPSWQGILSEAKKKVGKGRVCVSRGDLINLLQAMESACMDKRDDLGALFIEFGMEEDGLLIRSANQQTGQHVIGYITCLNTGGRWMTMDYWEKNVMGDNIKRLKTTS